jgi:hypothetical protein
MVDDATEARLKRLREPFVEAQVGKLPRTTCSACSKSQKKVCDEHSKKQCQHCGNYMTTAHLHLDYVGHAAVTDRLLQVDPEWSWEPIAFDAEGAPLIQRKGEQLVMWVRLTVCGVTRLGVGTVQESAFDAPKQLIGDALRNAAMRFGVALDLWSKEELNPSEEQPVPRGGTEAQPQVAQGGTVQSVLEKRIEALEAEGLTEIVASLRRRIADANFPTPWPAGAARQVEKWVSEAEKAAPF